MKYVDRNSVKVPSVLADNGSKAASERAKVRKHYQDPNCVTYKFSVYKDKEVLETLNKLFSNRCAYCESSYKATSPTDIEHFRPKGSVSDAPAHKGYWWLASTWNNLLPSCILCNREQHNELFDHTTASFNSVPPIKSGKYDNFPLIGPYRAFEESDDLTLEDPLLIDPTQRDPSEYLIWKEMQGFQVIVPKEEAATIPYARASIQTYGLNRRFLVEERTRIAQAIKADAKSLTVKLNIASELEPEKLAIFMPDLEDSVKEFFAKKKNPPQFAGMIEYLVDREIEKILNQLQALKDRLSNLPKP